MVSIIRRSLFCFSLLVVQFHLFAQWSVSGKVTDASNGEGLSYVNIHIDQTTLGTTSDQRGHFVLEGLTNDHYRITFSMIGFRSQYLDIRRGSDPLFISLQPEIYLAEETVISASRKTQSLALAPASAAILTQHQLRAHGIRSFDNAFHTTSGIQVTRSSGGNVQSLSIRGASEVAGGGIGNRVLLLLDGRPAITPESGGALWNLVPLGTVERIEVIKGAYSSLFGSSAMGGIINVITRKPDTVAQTDLRFHYGFYDKPPSYIDYNHYRDFYGMDVTHSGMNGKWSYILNAAAKSNAGHREKTKFDLCNLYGKLIYHFSANRSFLVSAMYNDIFNDTPATWLSALQPYHVANFRKDDTQHRRELNADMHYVAYAHSRIKYSARFYYYGSFSDFVFNADPENDSTNVNTGKQFIDDEKVIVHRIGHATQLDFSLGDDHYLIGGLELQRDDVDGRPDTVLYGKHLAWNIGAFVQDQWTITKHLILTGGVRFDEYSIVHTFSEGNISPKIAAVYEMSDRIAVRALLARAFRNPSIAERYTKFEQGGGLTFLPNPLLRSEKLTLSAETGIKINTGNNLKWDVAVFYNRYKDLIYYQQRAVPGGAFLFEVINLNKAIMQGFEVGMDFGMNEWLRWQAGYTYLDARDASDNRLNDDLSYKSKHSGHITALFDYKRFNCMAQARGRSRIDEVFIYPGSEPDGYILFNSRISYKINSHLNASFAVANITNKQYEEIERYRMEGRNFTLELNMRL